MSEEEKNIDVAGTPDESGWVYSEIVRDHFMNPRNVLWKESDMVPDGKGVVGSPACGDMMSVWITVNKETERIKECKWRTFGCASAIASTSMMSVIVTENGGMSIHDAKHLKPQTIAERLHGLPERKIHCSVLGHLGLKAAIEDYESRA